MASQNPDVPVFCGWCRVAKGPRTRSRWDDLNRHVLSGTNPAEVLVWPETIEVRGDGGEPTGFYDVRYRTVRLYGEDQTRRFVPAALEVAQRKFYETFVRPRSREGNSRLSEGEEDEDNPDDEKLSDWSRVGF